jgi:hypothetical protein
MANVLDSKKQVAVISALAEGSSIRSIERITGIHRDTIMRLGVRIGKGCANVLDHKMRDLSCRHEVFESVGHPKAPKVYAWAYETDNPKRPRHVTVLHLGPVTSPLLAVRAAIVQEYRNAEAES